MDVVNLRYGNRFTHFVLGAQVTFEPCLWNIFSRDRTFPFKVSFQHALSRSKNVYKLQWRAESCGCLRTSLMKQNNVGYETIG